ncbi:MAG: hypothetical protein ACTHKJ_02355 [Candidatus Nitrosocosmicus sp.]
MSFMVIDRPLFSFCIDFIYCSRNGRYSIGQSSDNIGKCIDVVTGVPSLEGSLRCCCDSF